MPIENLIERIRSLAQDRNVATHQARGRNLIARLLFGKAYNVIIAAERDGKLGAPALDDARTQLLREKYGADVDVVTEIAAIELAYWIDEPIMSGNKAVETGRVPPFTALTISALEQVTKQAELKGMEIEWITLNPGNLYPGTHLRFVRTGGSWYAMEDLHFKDGSTFITAEFNGSIFRYRDKDDEEGTHRFLTHVYEGDKWHLRPSEHSLAEADEFDSSWVELSFG
jgi:hypothetical protein